MMWRAGLMMVVVLGWLPGLLRAQAIEITAPTLEVQEKTGLAEFSGGVEVVRGDLMMRADRLVAEQHNRGGDLAKLVAEGNVRLVRGTETATGARAEFLVEKNQLVMTGNPVQLTRAGTTLTGTRLVYDVQSGKAQLTSDGAAGGRVRVRYVPQGEAGQ